jgi:hypothetical protein
MPFEWTWLRGQFEDPVDLSSFAAVKIAFNGQVLTRLYDHIAGGERDRINVVLYPLALAIAENWWRLLYEPRKSDAEHSSAESLHSLDAWMGGFVFPALTLWSGGDDAITVEYPNIPQRHSNIEFLPSPTAVNTLPRHEIEEDLFALVQAVLGRIPRGAATTLEAAWNRVLDSLRDADERQYCEAAGRLGIDPYDPDAEDISSFARGLSDRLFVNICEATTLIEMPEAVDWAREGTRRLADFPEIDLQQFGALPARNLQERIWLHGYEAARLVRRNLRLDDLSPRRVVDQIFGTAVTADGIAGAHPLALEAITNRRNGAMRVVVPRTSARQRRFRLCRASYLGWKTADGDFSAVTTSTTLDQQASRAFAAELLAPEHLLRRLAEPDGLTPEKIDTFADESVCPEAAIIWQAHNHEIPLRGVVLPRG